MRYAGISFDYSMQIQAENFTKANTGVNKRECSYNLVLPKFQKGVPSIREALEIEVDIPVEINNVQQ